MIGSGMPQKGGKEWVKGMNEGEKCVRQRREEREGKVSRRKGERGEGKREMNEWVRGKERG